MRQVLIRALIVFLLFAIGETFGYFLIAKQEKLKVYTPGDLNPILVDASLSKSKAEHFIGNFNLTNQNGHKIDSSEFSNKIYVADFIFTTCPDICLAMTNNLKLVYMEYEFDDDIKFLSHSVTPIKDSVPVLKAYAKKMGVDAPKWHFVTGSKKHIYELARKHYFAAIDGGDGGPNDFIHSPNLVLVDKQKRIRGIYDGTNYDEIDQLIEDIQTLKEEYE